MKTVFFTLVYQNNYKSTKMKNFKIILIITLILDVIQFIPLVLAKFGGEMKSQMISDFKIEGLASSAPALEILDIMLYIFGFIYLGTIFSVIYTLKLKTFEGLKSATFVLFIVHLFWTLPDFVNLLSGSSAHPPIIIMILTLIPVVGLIYVSQKGELKS
ncbi:MAG: hypothetical protein P8M69_05655 [Flavobacteriaceae bacterium]|nr:hypothetical protein [Flavobacteriaceae bacterium]